LFLHTKRLLTQIKRLALLINIKEYIIRIMGLKEKEGRNKKRFKWHYTFLGDDFIKYNSYLHLT